MATFFQVGRRYSREELADVIGLPADRRKGGPWATGYSRWGDEVFVFSNVGIAGRTGHDYPNRWDGKLLVWMGKTGSSAHQPLIQDMVTGRMPTHVFWRGRDRAPFTYAGIATAVSVRETVPVEVTWSFDEPVQAPTAWAGHSKGAEEELGASRPVYRRGPPPSPGERTLLAVNGPASVYLMRLTGPVASFFPNLQPGYAVIKVGMSNDPVRRRAELNNGFPPGSSVEWRLEATREYPSARAAFEAEGLLLEDLRLGDRWIGGEFACVPGTEFPQL